jgi:hypothetical protein
MLKLHHMNLLNEIQETTLMMNLYQQQQLQQQQQQLQQQNSADFGSPRVGMDSMFQQRASLGLGTMGGGQFNPMQNMQQMSGGNNLQSGPGDQMARLAQLKQDIARQEEFQRQEMNNTLGGDNFALNGGKRSGGLDDDEPAAKKIKSESNDGTSGDV